VTTTLVQSALSQLKGLGTISSAAMRILALADDPGVSEERLYDALSLDPALSARVLKVVNSAFYRRQREIASSRDAIRLLGISAVRNIAIASSLHRLFRGGRSIDGFDPADLWTHATAVAALSRELAARSGKASPEEALLAGLLHDMGIIAEAQLWPSEFGAAVLAVQTQVAPSLRDAERTSLGMAHDEMGALLCSAWNLPNAFGAVCRHHHDVEPALQERMVLPMIVHVADVLAVSAQLGLVMTAERSVPDPQVVSALGLSELALAEALSATEANLAALTGMLAE
jgi:HD-like signal output (HDOD) protein